MKLKYEFVVRQIAGEHVLIPMGKSALAFSGMVTTNEVGAYICRRLAEPVSQEELLDGIRKAVPGDPYVIMLSHRNNQLDMWASREADLVLSGHGHGGVIRLPFVGGLLSVDRTLFPKDCEGLYTQGRTVLAVSRGLGGIRLWNRPHLPTIVLKSVNNS